MSVGTGSVLDASIGLHSLDLQSGLLPSTPSVIQTDSASLRNLLAILGDPDANRHASFVLAGQSLGGLAFSAISVAACLCFGCFGVGHMHRAWAVVPLVLCCVSVGLLVVALSLVGSACASLNGLEGGGVVCSLAYGWVVALIVASLCLLGIAGPIILLSLPPKPAAVLAAQVPTPSPSAIGSPHGGEGGMLSHGSPHKEE